MAQIEIKIKTDGKIEAETFGVNGKRCMDYLKIIEQLLNAKVYDSNYTSDYFEENNDVEYNISRDILGEYNE